MQVLKFASAQALALDEEQLKLINRQTMRPLSAEEVYVFRVAGCDDQVDRDGERFPAETLEGLAPMFVGRPVLFDHNWSASMQTARIYDAKVEPFEGHSRLVMSCYMLQFGNESTISAIDAGILREVSVGCSVRAVLCSICGKPIGYCAHRPGESYADKLCVGELVDPLDAYELSFVAVPAQPGAGVVKGHEKEEKNLLRSVDRKIWLAAEREKWRNFYGEF